MAAPTTVTPMIVNAVTGAIVAPAAAGKAQTPAMHTPVKTVVAPTGILSNGERAASVSIVWRVDG